MSEMKHTPLPWRVEENTDLIWGACNKDDTTTWGMGYPIVSGFASFGTWAKGKPDFNEKESNAAFIARACNSHYDILDGAKKALEVAESWIHDQLDGTPAFDAAWEELDSVRAAIAKAEGLA